MAIVNTHYGFCAKGGAAPKFTYTGEYNVRDDGVVELLTSGTLVFLADYAIDRFMVGGGSSGGSPNYTNYSSTTGLGGGAGGHTRTDKGISVTKGTPIAITIGRGGAAAWGTATGRYSTWIAGEATTWDADSVPGGNGGSVRNVVDGRTGRAGGSGGGSGAASTANVGIGGTDGGNGGASTGAGGAGQGTTTREFGEEGGKLYAAGGGGGTFISGQTPVYAPGGAGGGGAGAWSNGGAAKQAAGAGMANTGSGGGGGCLVPAQGQQVMGGSGASGIVCFRTAK